jgi:hypothetical protein
MPRGLRAHPPPGPPPLRRRRAPSPVSMHTFLISVGETMEDPWGRAWHGSTTKGDPWDTVIVSFSKNPPY